MKLRTLEEIEHQEKNAEEDRRIDMYMPPDRRRRPTYDLRPGPVKSFFLGVGDLLIALPKLVFRLLDVGLGIAIVLGIIGCIVFGLVYLFG